MKLLPSPSCSSSSSFSTSTFDAHACNPRAAAATPSCLSGILRRILCSGSLPTHPTDHVTEETSSVKSDDKLLQVKDLDFIKSQNETKPAAGIVARLMGLDSMPEMKQNHNSISRSQSMNSVDYFYKHLEDKHQRVRSTLSFREIPNFLELENEDYFILSFEGESKSTEFPAKQRSERNGREFKQRKEEEDKYKNRGRNKREQPSVRKTKKKILDPEEAKQFVLIDLKEKKKPRTRVSKTKPASRISTKNRHGRKSTRNVESECSSDELSPVSVLDSSQFLSDPEEANPLLGDAASNSPLTPRRKLSPGLEIPKTPSRNDNDLTIKGGKIAITKVVGNWIQREKYEEEICKITEMELEESNWKYNKSCEKHEDIGAGGIIEGFDSYILEGLIDEFVEQMYDLIFI